MADDAKAPFNELLIGALLGGTELSRLTALIPLLLLAQSDWRMHGLVLRGLREKHPAIADELHSAIVDVDERIEILEAYIRAARAAERHAVREASQPPAPEQTTPVVVH